MLQNTNKFSATARICAEFLPAMDRLEDLRTIYENDDYGKQYNAMVGAMKSCFSELGVTELVVQAGDALDLNRVEVIESRYSDTAPKDTIIEPLTSGLELEGNTVRLATCVASLGPEVEESSGDEPVTPSDEPSTDATEEVPE